MTGRGFQSEMYRPESDVDDEPMREEDDLYSDGENSDEDYILEKPLDAESEVSFHSDSSNMDITDQEVCNLKVMRENKKKARVEKEKEAAEKREKEKVPVKNKGKQPIKDKCKQPMKEKNKGKDKQEAHNEEGRSTLNEEDNDNHGGDHEDGYASDISSHCYDSDEERMACNSTDEDEIDYPVFNPKTEMKELKFQLGTHCTELGHNRRTCTTRVSNYNVTIISILHWLKLGHKCFAGYKHC